MSIWTIQIGTAAPVDPATLNLSGLFARVLTQSPDTISLTQDGAYDADAVIPYGIKATVFRAGAPWFQGTCTAIARRGSGSDESIQFTLSGPWWQLEQITYEQAATRYLAGSQQLVLSPRSILGSDVDGQRIDSAAAITDALQFALTSLGSAAQFQIGTINAPAQIPWEEVNALTCAELIRRVLRYAPDRVVYFDYATTLPTLHIVPRASLPTLTYAIGTDVTLIDNAITPRNDLQRDGVVITYERTDIIDGNEQRVITRDQAGTTSDPLRTLRLYIDLTGGNVSFLRQQVKTATIQASSAAWWTQRHAKLQGATSVSIANSSQTAIDDGEANDGTEYPRELMSGAIANWMAQGACEQVITADVTYTPPGGSPKTEKLRINLTGTNATTQIYSTVGSASPAEPTPVGLAADILSSIQTLQYDGTIILEDADIAATHHIAHRIHLTGGRPEWAAMGAQIYHVDYDIDAGRTVIRFGVAQHLSASDLLALYRTARDRKPALAATRVSSIGSANRLPDRTRNTSTADDGGASETVFALQTYWDGSALRVRPGAVNSVQATGLTPAGEPAQLWLSVTLNSSQAVTAVAVTTTEPSASETVAKLLLAIITWSDGVPTITPQVTGSQSLASCGTTHVFGRV
jgi:hypothetical protein